MRNFYYLFFLLFLGWSINAQTYTPMLDQHNEWQVISCYQEDCFKDIYYTDGDTIVNGKSHKILDGYHYISRSFLLREELDARKVYLTTLINNQVDEYLLYDFSLQEGDSIEMKNPITPFPHNGGYYKLDSIRQKPILGNNLGKFFYFSAVPSNDSSETYKPIWVEGVGSLSIVTAPGGHPNYYGVGQVSCFFKNGNLFYFDDAMQNSCDSIFSTRDLNNDFQVKFHVQNQIGILQSQEGIQIMEFYDLQGRRVHFEYGKNQKNLILNLSHLSKGNYILRLKTVNNQVKSIKFIVK
jgi:hypothetical protein